MMKQDDYCEVKAGSAAEQSTLIFSVYFIFYSEILHYFLILCLFFPHYPSFFFWLHLNPKGEWPHKHTWAHFFRQRPQTKTRFPQLSTNPDVLPWSFRPMRAGSAEVYFLEQLRGGERSMVLPDLCCFEENVWVSGKWFGSFGPSGWTRRS